MGGEKVTHNTDRKSRSGSPPRGRGKGIQRVVLFITRRITPAWAGKREPESRHRPASWDHPRVGGEKASAFHVQALPCGSPPRGRGKGSKRLSKRSGLGITPAWAGKRNRRTTESNRTEDHPRVGGEKYSLLSSSISMLGSPPRGRGKAPTRVKGRCPFRITPAWAGKRLKRSHRSGIFISGPIPFHSVLHRPAGSGGSRAGRDGSPAGQPQNTGPA